MVRIARQVVAGIERHERLRAAAVGGEPLHLANAEHLEVERTHAIRHDMVFRLALVQIDPIAAAGEQVDGRRGEQRELVGAEGVRQHRLAAREQQDDLDLLAGGATGGAVEPAQFHEQEAFRHRVVFLQQPVAVEGLPQHAAAAIPPARSRAGARTWSATAPAMAAGARRGGRRSRPARPSPAHRGGCAPQPARRGTAAGDRARACRTPPPRSSSGAGGSPPSPRAGRAGQGPRPPPASRYIRRRQARSAAGAPDGRCGIRSWSGPRCRAGCAVRSRAAAAHPWARRAGSLPA